MLYTQYMFNNILFFEDTFYNYNSVNIWPTTRSMEKKAELVFTHNDANLY